MSTQPNAKIHLVASAIAIAAGALLDLTWPEWAMVVFAIMAVWVAEGMNTAVEFLVDLSSPEIHPLAKNAKDVAAAAVLIAAFGSVCIAFLVFGPRIYGLLAQGPLAR